jgi:ribosomal RNA methyltransferase Nop2
MGRRAKNKQGDPSPFGEPSASKPSEKKLGKRKADALDDAPPAKARPAKKLRDDAARPVVRKATKDVPKAVKPKAAKTAPPAKKERVPPVQEDVEDGGDSEGWEDVDDQPDLAAASRCVIINCFMPGR